MSIGQKVVSAVGWSALIKIAFQAVNWAMTLLVIRILSPDDYGLMAISQVCINFMAGFANIGLGASLIQRDRTEAPIVASVFGLMLALSTALTILLSVAAYPIAVLYHDPRLVLLIQVASLGFLFNGLTTLPRTFMSKYLRIRATVSMEMSSGVLSAAAVLILAYAGFGVWALMAGFMVGHVARLAGFLVLGREYFVWPSFAFGRVIPLLPYGMFRTFEYFTWIAFTSSDVLIIGRLLGPAELGLYTVALNFAGMPLSKIAPIINSVAFPAFALVQNNPAEARFYALKATRMMATIAVPVFFGISALSPEIVAVIFGPQWTEAQPMLQILALAMSFRAILLVIPNYLQGIGDARASLFCTLTGAVLFPPAFALGCHWGIIGVCYAWMIGYPVMFWINALIVSRYARLDVKTLLLTPLAPLAAGAAMLLVLTALRPYAGDSMPVRIVVQIAAGAVAYAAVLALAFRPLATEILALLLNRTGREVPGSP